MIFKHITLLWYYMCTFGISHVPRSQEWGFILGGKFKALHKKQRNEGEDEPPEEVFGGGEEGLDGGARSDDFGYGECVETEYHNEYGSH